MKTFKNPLVCFIFASSTLGCNSFGLNKTSKFIFLLQKKTICWFLLSCFPPFLSFSLFSIFMPSSRFVAIAIFSDHRHSISFMFSIYCSLQLNHQHHWKIIYTRAVHTTNFLFHVLMIFGVLFGFSGFVFCFFFIFSVSPETHIEYSTSSYTANKKSKGGTFYTLFIFRLFCRYNNHPLTRKTSRRRNKQRTRKDVCEVQCCVNFKSRFEFFRCIFYDSDQVGYCWRIFLFLSFHCWANRIKLYR